MWNDCVKRRVAAESVGSYSAAEVLSVRVLTMDGKEVLLYGRLWRKTFVELPRQGPMAASGLKMWRGSGDSDLRTLCVHGMITQT